MSVFKGRNRHNTDMLSGSLWDKILMFALPLAASSMLQQLFNSADVAVVGKFTGKQALAAVGSNGPVINLLVNFFVGISVGTNVVIARYIGSGNEKRANSAAHTAVLVSVICGFVIMALGLLVSPLILNLIGTPDDFIDLAVLYLRIYFCGMPFMMLYNFCSAIFRSKGDTKKPLIYLFVSGIVNVILNLIFVIVFKMGVAGVAIATVISNMISSVLMLRSLTKEEGAIKITLKNLKIDKRNLSEIIRVGMPAGIQGMVFSISNVCVLSGLNLLGTDVVSASSAAQNYENLIYFMSNSFAQATVTFVSQNYGAGNLKRCKRAVLIGMGLSVIASLTMFAVFILFRTPLLGIYTDDKEIIRIASQRLAVVGGTHFMCGIMDNLSCCMRGLGYSLEPALISMAGACGLRVLWIYTVFKKVQTFAMLVAVYPISWFATALVLGIVCIYKFKVAEKKSARLADAVE